MDQELKSLQIQLDALKKEFATKLKSIEERIFAVEMRLSGQPHQKQSLAPDSVDHSASTAIYSLNSDAGWVGENAERGDSRPVSPSSITSSPKKVETPLWVKLGLSELLLRLFGPFAGFFTKLSAVYKHYQSQGKAPVFFMTAAGISALILGFGYLLQFSFSQYLSEVAKMLIAYAIATAVTIGGIYFTRKKTNMREYGSSIIGLGIILNYLCTYFSSDYYSIIPANISLIILATITACAYAIALLFETRIVAVVSLIGGAVAPVILGPLEQPPTLYFSYLLILVVAMLHLAQRIDWQPLAQISMVLSIALIQFSLVDTPHTLQPSMWLVALVHGFFYAFGYFAIRHVGRTNTISKSILLVISANLLFLLLTLDQIIEAANIYGMLLIFNSLAWLVCAAVPQRIFAVANGKMSSDSIKSTQVLSLLSAGVLAGVGILAVTRPEFLGLIWGFEGLILLYLGSRFNYFSIRVESYLILVVAITQSSFDTTLWIIESFLSTPTLLQLGFGWMNLMVAMLLIGSTVFILKKYQPDKNKVDTKIFRIANESLSVYISSAILLSIGLLNVQWMWVFAVVPLFLLIFRAKRHSLVFTEYFGFAHYLLLLVPIIISADQVGSLRFSLHDIVAQTARIEAFLCLWVIAEFYNRFNPNGRLIKFALVLRQVFYCLIPIFFLPSILNRYIDYFPLVIWGSSAISLFLFYKFHYKALQIETLVLVILSSLSAVVACAFVKFDDWDGYGLSSLALGVAFYTLVLWLWKAFERRPEGDTLYQLVRQGVKSLFTLSFYYFGLVLFILMYVATNSPMLAAAIVCVFFTVILIYTPILNPIRQNMQVMYLVINTIVAFVILSYNVQYFLYTKDIIISTIALITALCCTAGLVYLPRAQLTLVWKKLGGRFLQLWGFHLATIIAYVGLIETWFDRDAGPAISIALVAHATIVLFQTLKVQYQRLIWLASGLYFIAALKIILFDMGDFSLVEKIIAFMFIGALLLAAAYQYQRMRRSITQ
ncbi:MAG: DUF2339 domain-containing protein [Gammaproteobacteria bacterium]|nr:DUF2339 domain-containing protein [Gammaproteobacteria bacterium]